MNRDELQSVLAALHDELSGTDEVDEQTRAMLSQLTADIQRVVAGEADAAEQDASYSSRLRDMVYDFEARHPKIGSLLERLSDGLANLGI